MFLDLTNQCNLKCRYCFNYHKLDLIPSHIEIGLLEKILKTKITQRVKNWFLSGGEPLCYPYLDDALELFKSYGHRPKIATNGIGLKPEVAERWVSLGVQSVQISLDTLKASIFTEINGGSAKTHQTILDNLKYAVHSPLRVVVSSVLHQSNLHEIHEIMRFCYDLGIDSYTLYPNVPAQQLNTDLILPISKTPDVIDSLIESYTRLCSTRVIDMSIPCFQFSNVYSRWKNELTMRLHSCGAGQYNLKITSEGKVSTCICQDAVEFIVGDLHHQDIDQIWDSPEINKFRTLYTNIPECRICEYKEKCRGGCRNEAYVFGERGILSLDPHCIFFHAKADNATA